MKISFAPALLRIYYSSFFIRFLLVNKLFFVHCFACNKYAYGANRHKNHSNYLKCRHM